MPDGREQRIRQKKILMFTPLDFDDSRNIGGGVSDDPDCASAMLQFENADPCCCELIGEAG